MLEEDNVRQRTLSDVEIGSIVAKAGPYLGPMFLAYCGTGMREAEPRLLSWSRLDLDRRYNIVDEEDAHPATAGRCAAEVARGPRGYGKIPSRFAAAEHTKKKAPRVSAREAFGSWRALEDLNLWPSDS